MKKIINPWKGMEGYNCFGCAPNNEAGVKMEFYEDGDEVISIWKPQPQFQGWIDTLHGGIQAVLLDEICAWVVLRKLQTTGVTSKMETRYMKPVNTNDSHIVLKASIKERKRNIVFVEAAIYNNKEELCTKALCTYFTSFKLLLTKVDPELTISKIASAKLIPGAISTEPVMT
jgi:uncharacterized protein (TIGR00369 family)